MDTAKVPLPLDQTVYAPPFIPKGKQPSYSNLAAEDVSCEDALNYYDLSWGDECIVSCGPLMDHMDKDPSNSIHEDGWYERKSSPPVPQCASDCACPPPSDHPNKLWSSAAYHNGPHCDGWVPDSGEANAAKPTRYSVINAYSEEQSWVDDPCEMRTLKQISRFNGEVNRMSCQQLRLQLQEYQLSNRGDREVLKRRLKSYYHRLKYPDDANKFHQRLRYCCVIDFEATCNAENPPTFIHEIIEFPAILVDVEKLCIISEFHRYCRPTVNRKLTKFCIELTGISQEQVDMAEMFPDVLAAFEQWLCSNGISLSSTDFAVVTDGPWDMARFLMDQCCLSHIPYPAYASKWVNIRRIFTNFYNLKKVNLSSMLDSLGLQFEGRPHCGLDDTRNIARILLQMLADGAIIRHNERIHPASASEYSSVSLHSEDPVENTIEGQPSASHDTDEEEFFDCSNEFGSGEVEGEGTARMMVIRKHRAPRYLPINSYRGDGSAPTRSRRVIHIAPSLEEQMANLGVDPSCNHMEEQLLALRQCR